MKTVWSPKIDAILAEGTWLGNNGVRNWALSKDKALLALRKLSELDVTVLGGDVYIADGNSLRPIRDSWYFDSDELSSQGALSERSIAKATEYISGYLHKDREIYFSIVLNRDS